MHRIPILVLALSALLLAACGQKGALYLPDRNAKVITRPAPAATPAPTTAPQQSPANPDAERKKNQQGDEANPPN
jgi:predicted small lipoprotein YifL